MDDTQKIIVIVALAMVAVFFLVTALAFVLIVRPWLRAFLHGTPVLVTQIIAMRLRGNPPSLLVDAYIALRRAGVDATIADVENTYIDGRSRIMTSDDLVALVKKKSQAP